MGKKEDIVNLLNVNRTMTQGALAEAIYGDKKHSPNIYSALKAMVDKGIIVRTGSNPSYYSLSDGEIKLPEKTKQPNKKEMRDVSSDVISNKSIEEIEALVRATDNYGPENDLITRYLKKFPLNTDSDVDERIKNGDSEVVNIIARSNGKNFILFCV